MFHRWVGALVGLAMMGTAGPAHATLIDTGFSTIDTTTGLEFLDLTLTLGQSFNSVIGGFGGFVASGYQYATATELCSLLTSQGDVLLNCISPNIVVDTIAALSASLLVGLLGDTATPGTATFGIYDDGNNSDGLGFSCINATAAPCAGGSANARRRRVLAEAPTWYLQPGT